ncbi:MAG: hypothetical protein LC135_08695 [Phycisphaerae bacterium]|nr:hypothetical protein [Phycisphaerae bacterium]MCZ2399929.1 hypothetical protein [Phycisphaerae bacterium]NUQ49171.1 hypothetical protein [Phycisphaerae bacterium]
MSTRSVSGLGRPTYAAAAAARRGGMHPVTRLFSSITFGLVILVLILVYACVFSALPQVRGAIEVTEMQIFHHWVFAGLILLFCITLCVATWTRILHLRAIDVLNPLAVVRRFNALNAGVVITHAGLLMLAAGSLWYFGAKVEGDVLLRTARIELINTSGFDRAPIDAIAVEEGGVWGQNMPAFGGPVAFRVMRVHGDRHGPVQEVEVRARVGEEAAQTVFLTPERSVQAISERLALRLVVFPPEETFCDHELAALFISKAGDEQRVAHALAALPLHRERYLDEGSVLKERGTGAVSPSKRTWSVPVLEHWRLPIRIDAPSLPFDVQVTGYVPYVGEFALRAVPSKAGGKPMPAINYTVQSARRTITEPLLALDPARSLSRQAPIEFRWAETPAEREALLASLAGTHELEIELRDPPIRRTLAVTEGQTIELEGTSYRLTVESFLPIWEMASPELAGAFSPVATVRVESADKQYRRTVIQRFPTYSQDVDDTGKRHSNGPYDANLVLRYRTSDEGWLMVVAGPGQPPELGVFMPDGRVQRNPLAPGERVPLPGGASFVLHDQLERAEVVLEPLIEPVAMRRPSLGRQASAIRLRLTGKGAQQGWSESRWVMFSNYPHIDWPPYFPLRRTIVQLPGTDEQWEFVYSRQPHKLDAQILPGKLSVEFFPGRNSVTSWRSDFFVLEPGSGELRPGAVWTNQTHNVGRWTLFQSGADSNHWQYTILGVGNRRGIWPMTIGSVLVTFGSLYAFYVKPWIKRRRQARKEPAPAREAAAPKGMLEVVEARS